MFGFGIQEISIIVVIVVLLVGVRRLPELKAAATKAIQNLKDGISGDDEIDVTPPRAHDPKDDSQA